MLKRQKGFTLIELIAILVILGAVAVTASARFASTDLARLQASRDDLVAALFFAQQIALARSSNTNPIAVTVSSGGVSVTENGTPVGVHQVTFPAGVTASAANINYDKLGRTTNGTVAITLSAGGGNEATVTVSGSGYAYY